MRVGLLLLLSTLPVLGCLNLTEKNLDGQDVDVEPGPGSEEISVVDEDWKARLATLDQRLTAIDPDGKVGLETRNDRGVCLAHLGKSREALEIFRKLEASNPGIYGVAANLGTCYELCGQDSEALHWIQVGLQRNPDSHGGTEWLHVKILQAKLALARDPKWLQTHSVLGYSFGDDLRPTYPPDLADQAARDRLRKALRYQLSERMGLVAPPDPVVGDLLFDLANLCALMKTAHRGEMVMQESLRYGPPRLELAQKRLAYFASFDKQKKSENQWWRPALAVVGLLGVLSLGWRWFSRSGR